MKHVLLDTNVIFSEGLRGILLFFFEQCGEYYPHWSQHVISEMKATQRKRKTNSFQDSKSILSESQVQLWPNAHLGIPSQHAELNAKLRDPGDQSIFSSAVEFSCEMIVTYNVKDFPNSKLRPHHVRAIHPDKLLLDLLQRKDALVILQKYFEDKKSSKLQLTGYLKKIALVKSAMSIERNYH